MSDTMRSFMLILGASFVFSAFLARIPRLRVPSAIGYLLFGMFLQTGAIPMAGDEVRWIHHLGDFGLLFLMFLSGMEVDVGLLRVHEWQPNAKTGSWTSTPLGRALSIFFTTLVLSFVLSWILTMVVPVRIHPWMLTLLFSTTSLGIIVPVLEEVGVLHTRFGQTLLLSALLADLFTMLLVSLFVSVQTSGRFSDFLLTLSIIPLTLLCYIAYIWARRVPAARQMAGDLQTRIRGLLALVAGFCAFADFTGSEPILGSFLVGMLVSTMKFAFQTKVRDYVHGIGYGFFIPLFFMSVGLHFEFGSFRDTSSWVWVPGLLLMALAVKVFPALQLRQEYGLRRALAAGFMLTPRLGLVVAAAQIGVHIGVLPAVVSESMVMVAVLTCLIAPMGFVALL